MNKAVKYSLGAGVTGKLDSKVEGIIESVGSEVVV